MKILLGYFMIMITGAILALTYPGFHILSVWDVFFAALFSFIGIILVGSHE